MSLKKNNEQQQQIWKHNRLVRGKHRKKMFIGYELII